jgi:IS1 family transposase
LYFSETAFSDIYGKHGSFKEYSQCCKLLSYGLNADEIADILDRDVRTILSWIECIANKAEKFHLFMCISLIINFLQLDELWSYVNNKKKQLSGFTSIDAKSRFWLNFELGSRTKHTANKLLKGLSNMILILSGKIIKFTTDKLSAYVHAIEEHFSGKYAYLQIVKKRYKKILITVKKVFVRGSDIDFPGKTQNTSYIERHNLTLRDRVSYLGRKTIAYCKKKAHFKRIMWINLFDYNYIRFHKSLRTKISNTTKKFEKKYIHKTPAMELIITKKQLNWKFLLTYPIL